ncbi:MAG: IS1595 family transposase [Rhodospirillales bacterium]|nr:IS1595 family transposase [Rhodospirillales bacterium]
MKYTFQEFIKEYPTDEACLDKIMSMKYGSDPVCPGCGAETKFHRITKRRAYACQHCGHHVYPCVGTPFEKSRTSLQKWFYAMFLFTSSKHGVPAKELQRQLGVTYKCAWRIADELRKLMANSDDHEPLSGHVEIDETYVGGKPRRGKRKPKAIVFGMLQRGGTVRAGIVPDTHRKTLFKVIAKNVQRGSKISTDELPTYWALKSFGYDHGMVKHQYHEYSYKGHSTNGIEGYWSRLKMSIRGTHVHVSRKHLWKYVCEFSYRYNNRAMSHGEMFNDLVSCLRLPRLAEN